MVVCGATTKRLHSSIVYSALDKEVSRVLAVSARTPSQFHATFCPLRWLVRPTVPSVPLDLNELTV